MKRTLSTAVSTLALALSAAAAVLSTPGTASAVTWEEDFATSATSADCSYIMDYSIAFTCFQKYGDIWFVNNQAWSDPAPRVSVQWWNQLKNASGTWVDYRAGECFNDLGVQWMGKCNKDYYEDSS